MCVDVRRPCMHTPFLYVRTHARRGIVPNFQCHHAPSLPFFTSLNNCKTKSESSSLPTSSLHLPLVDASPPPCRGHHSGIREVFPAMIRISYLRLIGIKSPRLSSSSRLAWTSTRRVTPAHDAWLPREIFPT